MTTLPTPGGPDIKTGAAAAPAPGRTPSADYDVMNAPVYVPAAAPQPRPGSLDFQRCPSRGTRC